jgi:hypothetical protein
VIFHQNGRAITDRADDLPPDLISTDLAYCPERDCPPNSSQIKIDGMLLPAAAHAVAKHEWVGPPVYIRSMPVYIHVRKSIG